MKVFVVAQWWEYEGYSEPLAVFSTKEAAEAYIASHPKWMDGKYSGADVTELELDHAAD